MAHYAVLQGRPLAAGDRHAVILGAGLAAALGKSPGENVDLEGIVFSIAGVFQTGDALESNTAVATLGDLQELMDRPGQVSEFQIQVAPAAAGAAAGRRLCAGMEGLVDESGNPLGLKAMPMRDFVAANTEASLLLGMAQGTSAIAIFLCSLGLLNTMLMSVIERTRELGILRAVGWSRSLIAQLDPRRVTGAFAHGRCARIGECLGGRFRAGPLLVHTDGGSLWVDARRTCGGCGGRHSGRRRRRHLPGHPRDGSRSHRGTAL